MTGMLKVRLLRPFMFALMLAACTPSMLPAATSSPMPPTMVQATGTVTPRPPAMARASATQPRQTPSATPTQATGTPASPIVMQCAQSIDFEDGSILAGANLLFQVGAATRLLQAGQGSPSLVTSNFVEVEVSPYTGSLAWFSRDAIRLVREDGSEYSLAREPDWGLFRQWLADDRLLLDVAEPPRENYMDPFPAQDEFYIVSPLTGESEHVRLDFPGYMAVDLATMSRWRSIPLYNPVDMDTAVYAWQAASYAPKGLLVVHVPSRQTLWSTDWERLLRFSSAHWTHDGSRVVVTALISGTVRTDQHELMSAATDGTAVQLTQFAAHDINDYFMFNPTWSPDGRYVAFIFATAWTTDQGSVHVVDTVTGQVTDYCTGDVQRYPGLFWSPDSRQLAFRRGDFELVVLDLEGGLMQVLPTADGYIPDIAGWTRWAPPGN